MLNRFFGFILRLFVIGYRRLISPFFPPSCRYHPTCSQYALEAIEVHGGLKGFWLAIKRVGRCHPWGGSGLDPVPDVENKTNNIGE